MTLLELCRSTLLTQSMGLVGGVRLLINALFNLKSLSFCRHVFHIYIYIHNICSSFMMCVWWPTRKDNFIGKESLLWNPKFLISKYVQRFLASKPTRPLHSPAMLIRNLTQNRLEFRTQLEFQQAAAEQERQEMKGAETMLKGSKASIYRMVKIKTIRKSILT